LLVCCVTHCLYCSQKPNFFFFICCRLQRHFYLSAVSNQVSIRFFNILLLIKTAQTHPFFRVSNFAWPLVGINCRPHKKNVVASKLTVFIHDTLDVSSAVFSSTFLQIRSSFLSFLARQNFPKIWRKLIAHVWPLKSR